MKLFPKTRHYLFNLYQALVALTGAIRANSANLQANTLATATLLATAQQTQKAVAYLAAVERHRQAQAGQKHEF